MITIRSTKHSAVCADDESELAVLFDEILLNQSDDSKYNCKERSSSSSSTKTTTRSKKRQNKINETTVNLWSLLTQCAQATARYDQTTETTLLSQIRQHSSPNGSAIERLTHYFANQRSRGPVMRRSATSEVYTPHVGAKIPSSEMLRAHHVCLVACPFVRMSIFYPNLSILKLSQLQNAKTIHVIDFGILCGFQ